MRQPCSRLTFDVRQNQTMKFIRKALGILSVSAASVVAYDRPTQKAHLESLIDSALPFAEQMLAKHQEFFPYGAKMLPDLKIVSVGGYTGEEHPKSVDVISLLQQAYIKEAKEKKIIASALVYDIRTIPPGATEKTDAVAIDLDHRDGFSVIMVYPYRLDENKKPVFGQAFAMEGKAEIFQNEN